MIKSVLIAAGLALVAGPALATTSISGTVAAGAAATLDTLPVDSHTDSTTVLTPTAVSFAAQADGFVDNGQNYNHAYNFVGANWYSADAGDVHVTWGWDANASVDSLLRVANSNVTWPLNWSYSFTATGNGSFSGNYVVRGTGDTFGLQSLYALDDFGSFAFGGDVYDPSASGSFSVPLILGQTYTMTVANYGNIGSAFAYSGEASADVQWAISYDSAVPEPASWGLMIGGFGMVGGTLRRRRAVAA